MSSKLNRIEQGLRKYLIPVKGIPEKAARFFKCKLLCNGCSLKASGLKSSPKYYIRIHYTFFMQNTTGLCKGARHN